MRLLEQLLDVKGAECDFFVGAFILDAVFECALGVSEDVHLAG